jgi:hypothetical protein
VLPSKRRFTRSCHIQDGYKPNPVLAVHQKIEKRVCDNLLVVNQEKKESKQAEDKENADQEEQWKVTPIQVMQRVGLQLEITLNKLMKEQLEAKPEEKHADEVNDD